MITRATAGSAARFTALTSRVTHVLALLLVLALAAFASASAWAATLESFAGKWAGSWQDTGGPGGAVEELTIEPVDAEVAAIAVRLTNAVVPGFGARARLVDGDLVVSEPTLSIVLRLRDKDRLDGTYHNARNDARGVWVLTRQSAASAPSGEHAVAAQLVSGSPWEGTFANPPRADGRIVLKFLLIEGSLAGEVVSIAGSPTGTTGRLDSVRVKDDKVTFRMPGNNVAVELRLSDGKLAGQWFGRSSGAIALAPAKR